jgi:transcription antitermination protein NusB
MTQHEKRIQLMHLLYQYDLSLQMEKKPSYLSEEDLSESLQGILDVLEDIDHIISSFFTTYRINRLSYVDRAIIRLATYEMHNLKLEPEIAINEALNLTRAYSMLDDEKQVKFSNKLLDSISKYIKEHE